MSTQAIDDYLTRQIVVEKNIVTCRSLSRAQGLQVNVAKNELLNYLEKAKTREDALFATYRLTGTLKQNTSNDKDMAVDAETGTDGYEDVEPTDVIKSESILVSEHDLAAVRKEYASLSSFYIYALSPSLVTDPALVCNSDTVRLIDRAKGDDFARVVGKIVGQNIKVIPQKLKKPVKAKEPIAGPSKVKTEELKLSNPKATEAGDKKQPAVEAGKLDCSKAKIKVTTPKAVVKDDAQDRLKGKLTSKVPAGFFKVEKKEEKIPPRKSMSKSTETDDAKPTRSKSEQKKAESKKPSQANALLSDSDDEPLKKPEEEKPKRVLKRKSEVIESGNGNNFDEDIPKRRLSQRKSTVSESDDDSQPPSKSKKTESKKKISSAPRPIKKLVVDSDEEDEIPVRRLRKMKKAVANDPNSELEAMMAVSDENVIRVARDSPETTPVNEDLDSGNISPKTQTEDDMDIDVPVIPKQTRKTKTTFPRGKNGLKKRRVMRERQSVDEKGYEHFEDYSSYESVSEEEGASAPKKARANHKPRPVKKEDEGDNDVAPSKHKSKPKLTKAKEVKEVVKKETEDSDAKEARTKTKKKPAPKKGQQNIASFFGKK